MTTAQAAAKRPLVSMTEHSSVERIENLERSVFGFFDKATNKYVPGFAQIAADSASQLKQIKYLFIVFCVVAAGSSPIAWKIVEAFIK